VLEEFDRAVELFLRAGDADPWRFDGRREPCAP
jgi:hypothetical protein